MNKLMLVLFFLLFPLNLSAFPYLCIIEDSIGYYKNEKTRKWENQNFREREKYLLTKSILSSNIAVLKKFGEKYAVAMCGELDGDDVDTEIIQNKFKNRGVLDCGGVVNAKINVKTLEIIISSYGGYAYGVEKNSDSPYLSIGTCSPL